MIKYILIGIFYLGVFAYGYLVGKIIDEVNDDNK